MENLLKSGWITAHALRKNRQKILYFSMIVLSQFFGDFSNALPAFAFKEGQTSCALCHANNAIPHLTRAGYEYRRAGFRFPNEIGKEDKDSQSMNLLHHLAAGINVDYIFGKNKPPGEEEKVTNDNFDVREAEIWPVVGGFYGNYGAWSELVMSPNTAADRTSPTPPNVTTSSNGSVELDQADLRYVTGDANLFFNLRVGLVAPEGYGASDQWIDDGNLPLIDQLSAYFNQDTLVTPLGAFQSPQMGAEFGVNWPNTFLTLGIYNGFDGTNGFANQVQSSLAPRSTSSDAKNSHDYKAQVEQFWGENFAFTAVQYWGTVPLLDPQNTLVWRDGFQSSRLYLTYSLPPSHVDLFAGGAYSQHQYVNPGTADIQGHFSQSGAFLGANWYATPQITFSTHLDQFKYAREKSPSATGGSLMMAVSLEPKSVWTFHYNVTNADIDESAVAAGRTNEFRAEWRFFF